MEHALPAGTATFDTVDTSEDHRLHERGLAAEWEHQRDRKVDNTAVSAHSGTVRPIASRSTQVG